MSAPVSMRGALLRAGVVTLFGLFWVSLFWLQPARQWPLWGDVWLFFDRLFLDLFSLTGRGRWVVKSALFVTVPLLLLWGLGKPPRALGFGKMADKGWRIIAVGFLVSLPVLLWLGFQPGMQSYYRSMFSLGAWDLYLSSSVVIFFEHVFIEGIILALALPGGSFEAHGEEPPRQGPLAFLGFGFTPGPKTLGNWLGVPLWVWPALIGQALVFGVVHFGKEVSELISAFPGGLGLGLLTWRIRTVWPSVILHLGTGAIILGAAYLAWRW